ncbi:unnamed protein product [Owenia fusiformis]|uniref:Uncharacterized protein n=1 Tax=Owenia fusiformis TaxID=6347 RepID=A0A8J1XK09_OWEFU|nr:unnamed protein product [Owenia fusiformis]
MSSLRVPSGRLHTFGPVGLELQTDDDAYLSAKNFRKPVHPPGSPARNMPSADHNKRQKTFVNVEVRNFKYWGELRRTKTEIKRTPISQEDIQREKMAINYDRRRMHTEPAEMNPEDFLKKLTLGNQAISAFKGPSVGKAKKPLGNRLLKSLTAKKNTGSQS